MDAVGSVCFFVIVAGTCIVVNGCLDYSTIVAIITDIIVIIINSVGSFLVIIPMIGG
jgi:hypothetical protein